MLRNRLIWVRHSTDAPACLRSCRKCFRLMSNSLGMRVRTFHFGTSPAKPQINLEHEVLQGRTLDYCQALGVRSNATARILLVDAWRSQPLGLDKYRSWPKLTYPFIHPYLGNTALVSTPKRLHGKFNTLREGCAWGRTILIRVIFPYNNIFN